jgi:hypothetical protein
MYFSPGNKKPAEAGCVFHDLLQFVTASTRKVATIIRITTIHHASNPALCASSIF